MSSHKDHGDCLSLRFARGCPTRTRTKVLAIAFSQERSMREATVEQWRNLHGLIAEAAALRDRADRACRETQTLRTTYRQAIQQSHRLLWRPWSTSRAPFRPGTPLQFKLKRYQTTLRRRLVHPRRRSITQTAPPSLPKRDHGIDGTIHRTAALQEARRSRPPGAWPIRSP